MKLSIKDQKNEFLQDKNQIENQIEEILKKQKDDKTLNSLQCMRIIEQLEIIKPMLDKVDKTIENVDDQKLGDFYRVFRNIFKQFQREVKETQDQINDGTFGADNKISKQKMKEIKELILNMKDELSNINNKMTTPCRKCIVWLDYTVNNQENTQYLLRFQDLCNGAVEEFMTCNKNDDFQDYVTKNLNSKLLYIIMSGSSAGSFRETDGRNLEWLKKIKRENLGSEFIQGVFIFTSPYRENEFKPLIDSEKGFVYEVTADPHNIFDAIQNVIFPKDCVRVVPVVKLCHYLDKELRYEFLLLKKEEEENNLDYSKFQLIDFHPANLYKLQCNFQFFELKEMREGLDDKNLKERLKMALKIVKDFKIQILDSTIDPEGIYQDFLSCFQSQDNQKIAIKILTLYTNENSKFYKFLNTLLSVLNQDMLIIFWDLIQCFRAALVIYDDSKFSKIKKPPQQDNKQNQIEYKEQVTLYRGTPIPINIFQSLYKPGEIICMCGFSSFSLNPQIAYNFSFGGKSDVRVIFKLEFKYGTKQYEMRPKSLIEISHFKSEEEYLINCGSVFKIKSVFEQSIAKDQTVQIVEITL
ncbi:hypothetical protein ABPG72_018132 [Tetrahymena utriculariae]